MDQVARVPEIALSAAWHREHIPNTLTTTDGESVSVIHRGRWTHGLGPDFADALLLFNERELRSGAVEMHLKTSGWQAHHHQYDAAYNSVILHVVARHDGVVTRRADGGLVPVVEVALPDIRDLPEAMLDWSRVGGSVCAPRLARSSPEVLRGILHTLGDTRLTARSAQVEASLLDVPPVEVLWRAILRGLGYARNQAPMQRLGALLPLATLEDLRGTQPPAKRFALTLGLLLGVAGFLPLSPVEAHLMSLDTPTLGAIELAWRSWGTPWHSDHLDPSTWERARVRPANHPLPRLRAAAALVQNAGSVGGLLPAITAIIEAEDPVDRFRDYTRWSDSSGIGEDRAIEILASAVLPVVFALASHNGDEKFAEAAARAWDLLPSPSSTSITKRALAQVYGGRSTRGLGARGSQGLIHLDTVLCQPRRCFECPVALAELSVNE